MEDPDETSEKIYDKMTKKLHTDFGNTLYIKGIPQDSTESDILKLLKNPGKVVRVNLVRKNNEQKDFCYVEMDSKESAEFEVENNSSAYKIYVSKPPSDYDENNTLFVCALP